MYVYYVSNINIYQLYRNKAVCFTCIRFPCTQVVWTGQVHTALVPPPVVGGRLLEHTALNQSGGRLHSSQTTFHPSSIQGMLFRLPRFLLTPHNTHTDWTDAAAFNLSEETKSYPLHLVPINTKSLEHVRDRISNKKFGTQICWLSY